MMPFWDETSADSLEGGIPRILTQEKFELDGKQIDNPLKSFTLPAALGDEYWGDNTNGEKTPYYKPAGYETVRYPLSGLVGNMVDKTNTELHNDRFRDPARRTELLDRNVVQWLHGAGPNTLPNGPGGPTSRDRTPTGNGVYDLYQRCLDAPNYTAFSNTTSAAAWNLTNDAMVVTPLEEPHNDIHLSVGGFDLPGVGESGQISGANGDMGENNTAALIRSSSSTTATSIACSGSGRSGTARPRRWRSSRATRARSSSDCAGPDAGRSRRARRST